MSPAEIEQAIVNTVSYVDAFDYPLTTAEIHRYLIRLPASAAQVSQALHRNGLAPYRLRRSGDYYMLPGREEIARIRAERQATADRLWPEAARYGRLIARMPFVRMVAVTGSLAVNNVGPHEDIDYLIVTADDHLWVCRAFVILIVRWAARRGVAVCPNYFLAERALCLDTHNLYTAHELTQMIPLHGLPVYHTLRRVNRWTRRYLPNASGPPPLRASSSAPLLPSSPAPRPRAARPPGHKLLEAALSTPPGRRLDRWEMSRKVRKFRRQYHGWQEAEFSEGEFSEAEFSAECCKGHFNRHQQRAIRAYERLVGDAYDEALADDLPLPTPL